MSSLNNITLLDCTLRDGGYYNAWDFEPELIAEYLNAVAALPVDIVEIGFRSMPGNSRKFKGGCAYCTDPFISSLEIPKGLRLAVMVNGADLTNYPEGIVPAVERLFGPADASPVELVRIAVHVHKVEETLPAITRLKELGYKTTFQLMQIAGLTSDEVQHLAKSCSEFPLDVLYFADSLGSMVPDAINQTIDALRTHWQGELGFHAHNNMQGGVANCIRSVEQGVTWIDGTVLGMGRGPGNAPTEYLAIEMQTRWGKKMHHTPLLDLISKYFKPMQQKYGWGPNSYYYMAGKFGIHPTYVQEMINDTRYDGEDILAVVNHLKATGGKHYSLDTLEAARNFYSGELKGTWHPASLMKGRDVLLLGSGPGVARHRRALENYIRKEHPFVMALNTHARIDPKLIDVRVACHPVRLLADCNEHARLPHPLITPASMLPMDVKRSLGNKELLDFGLGVKPDTFVCKETYAILPTSLVVAYALAAATSGQVNQILLAGFDGYDSDDPRNIEMNNLIKLYKENGNHLKLTAVTPSRYQLKQASIYEL